MIHGSQPHHHLQQVGAERERERKREGGGERKREREREREIESSRGVCTL
jgi:hypothetical protein